MNESLAMPDKTAKLYEFLATGRVLAETAGDAQTALNDVIFDIEAGRPVDADQVSGIAAMVEAAKLFIDAHRVMLNATGKTASVASHKAR